MRRKALMVMTWMMLALSGVTALSAQDAQLRVDVGTRHESAWYTNPLYIGIGIIILLLIVLIATRGRSSGDRRG